MCSCCHNVLIIFAFILNSKIREISYKVIFFLSLKNIDIIPLKCVVCDVFTLSERNICKISHANIQTPTDIRSAGVLIILHPFFLCFLFSFARSLAPHTKICIIFLLFMWNCVVKTGIPTNDASFRSMHSIGGVLFHFEYSYECALVTELIDLKCDRWSSEEKMATHYLYQWSAVNESTDGGLTD